MMLRRLVLLAMVSAVLGMLLLLMQMASFGGPAHGAPADRRMQPTGNTFNAHNNQPLRASAGVAFKPLPHVPLHSAVNLSPLPSRPSTVTLVSGFWDIGRGTMQTTPQWSVLRRPVSHYLDGLKKFLAYRFPKVLLCDTESCAAARPLVEAALAAGAGPCEVVVKSLADLATEMPQYNAIQNLRANPSWRGQSDLLSNSPQAKLEKFLPLVLSKLRFARDVARWNPFNTDSFLWMDAAFMCHDPIRLTPNKLDNIVRFLDKFLLTFHDFNAPGASEVFGFARSSFNTYLGRSAGDKSAITVARGGVFGGRAEFLEAAFVRFDALLTEMLSAGVMGTDQALFTLLEHRFPELVHHFEMGDYTRTCAVVDAFVNPPMDPKVDGWETRGLTCRFVQSEGAVRCFDGLVKCPDHVTPHFLEVAEGQAICTEEPESFYCRLVCESSGEVTWRGAPCPSDGVSPCPPWPRTKLPEYNPDADPKPPSALIGAPVAPRPQMPAPSGDDTHFTGPELLQRADTDVVAAVERNGGFDLRGLGCEILDGQERCFYEDTEGREQCPPTMTSALLTAGDGQYLCLPETEGYYCTASCAEGTTIQWHAHETKWCEANVENCPPKPPIVPIDQYKLGQWSEKVREPMQCPATPAGEKLKISVVILAYKETESLSASLKTYEDAHFLEHVDETILYLNARNAEMEAVAEKYTHPPYNVKIMGDSHNYGIGQALTWMFGNASNEHVLFLEKDFRLVESLDCALDQLKAGKAMLESDTAHVIRYRSRHNPGRPNWARILYMGHEDDVFKNQPNLLCNFFHWIDSPDKRWPEQFYPCWKGTDGEVDRSKVFYCSKAYYCNWTNNPVLISKTWWHTFYGSKLHDKFGVSPIQDLELFMNWEPGAWNDRPWVVAQGEGMFRHLDKKKWGM